MFGGEDLGVWDVQSFTRSLAQGLASVPRVARASAELSAELARVAMGASQSRGPARRLALCRPRLDRQPGLPALDAGLPGLVGRHADLVGGPDGGLADDRAGPIRDDGPHVRPGPDELPRSESSRPETSVRDGR